MEAPLNFNTTQPKFYVLYGLLRDTDEGAFLDHSFLGGEAPTIQEATRIARDITNDLTLPGSPIIKIQRSEKGSRLQNILQATDKHFNRMACEIYDNEEMLKRKKRK